MSDPRTHKAKIRAAPRRPVEDSDSDSIPGNGSESGGPFNGALRDHFSRILQCSLFPVDEGASPLPSDDDGEEPHLLTVTQLASEVGDSLFI